MSDQRDAIVAAIRLALKQVHRDAKDRRANPTYQQMADSVLPFVDAARAEGYEQGKWAGAKRAQDLVAQGVAAEREQTLTDVQRRVDHADRNCKEWPTSGYWHGRREGLAELRDDLRKPLVSREAEASR
jgi:hypothetical protein